MPRAGIPIPSFGRAVDVTPSLNGSPDTQNNALVPAQWKVSALLQLEVSLQHWFRRKQQQKSAATMSLEEFFALVRKLDWSQTNDDSTITNDDDDDGKLHGKNDDNKKKHSELVMDLTLEERLLHDFLCVAANPSNNDPLHKIDLETQILQPRQSSVEKLKRLLASTKTFEEAWSNKVGTMIRNYRSKQVEENKKKASTTTNNSSTSNNTLLQSKSDAAVITKDMAIDERVRARAKAKQEQLEEEENRKKKDSKHLASSLIFNNDRTWMIQLADALWTHARSILARQNQNLPNKLASNSIFMANSRIAKKPKTAPPKRKMIVSTFKDVIATIAKSRIGEASPIQIAKALTELETYNPKWISVSRGGQVTTGGNKKQDGSKNKSYKWSQTNTTIFITPGNYEAVRSQLTGVPISKAKGQINATQLNTTKLSTTSTAAAAATAATAVAKTSDKDADDASTPSATSPVDAPRKRPSPVVAKNLLSDFDGTAEGSPPHKDKKAKTMTTEPTKKKSFSLNSLCRRASSTAQLASNNPCAANSKKRERETTEATTVHHQKREQELSTSTHASAAATFLPQSTPLPSSPGGSPHRKRSKLRVNHFHTLIDADHVGGEVIAPKLGASPNQLRSLFFKLNNGERI